MKILLLLFTLISPVSIAEPDSIGQYDSSGTYYKDLYQNLYSSNLFFPDALDEDTVVYSFSDSLFIGYERLRDLELFNELQGDLFDFFYYNFDIIDSRYRQKKVFENQPPDQAQWDSIKQLDNRQPCDSVVFGWGGTLFYTWFPCLTPPLRFMMGFIPVLRIM